MSERKQKSHPIKKSDAVKRLADDLASLNQDMALPESIGDEEMLSLIVEEANKGIDISSRYPTFYKKLLNHPDLLQAFLDVLDSIEDEEQNQPIPWADSTAVKLDFLAGSVTQPIIEWLGDIWKIHWRRTIDQLQAVFSHSELAYRSDPGASDDLWFILLRDEIALDGSLYSIALECTFSDEQQHALTPFLNVAVTVGSVTKRPAFPIRISLQWGTYMAAIQIGEEGRVKFPNIPLPAMFDKEYENVNAELNLTIEPIT
jgi:hypothetical protein